MYFQNVHHLYSLCISVLMDAMELDPSTWTPEQREQASEVIARGVQQSLTAAVENAIDPVVGVEVGLQFGRSDSLDSVRSEE
jgi:hypothetical protein